MNLRILYGIPKIKFDYLAMFATQFTVLAWLHVSQPPAQCLSKSKTWSGSLLFCSLWRFFSSWSSFWLIKANALNYVHQVAELICTKLGLQWRGPALSVLKEEDYMESKRGCFRLRNGIHWAAVDGCCWRHSRSIFPQCRRVAEGFKLQELRNEVFFVMHRNCQQPALLFSRYGI